MKLFILFGQFPNQAPVAMTVVDELTVLLSGRKEDEYKRLILDLTVNSATSLLRIGLGSKLSFPLTQENVFDYILCVSLQNSP